MVDFTGKTALVVDDKLAVHRLLESLLYQLGFRKVWTALNGAEAMDKLTTMKGEVDIILCDLEMPVMNGIDFIKNLRKSRLNQVPVLVVTAHGDRERLQGAVDAGVEGFVVKPVTAEHFASRVSQALQKRRSDSGPKPAIQKAPPAMNEVGDEASPDVLIKWTDDLRTGHKLIDMEHQKLFGLINDFYRCVKEDCGSEITGQAFESMLEYTTHIFRHEEEIMRDAGYPDYQAHKDKHEVFSASVNRHFVSFQAGNKTAFEELLNLLATWWAVHVSKVDRKLSAFLARK